MNSYNLLRRQVTSELKKRRLIFFTIVSLTLLYISISFILGDTGLIRYFELSNKKSQIEQEIKTIKRSISDIEEMRELMREGAFHKPWGHGLANGDFAQNRSMNQIGG